MSNFAKWFDTFNEEKGFDPETNIRVEGENGTNLIPLGCLFDAIKSAPANEQSAIQKTLVKIDFINGRILPFYEHLAKAIAI